MELFRDHEEIINDIMFINIMIDQLLLYQKEIEELENKKHIIVSKEQMRTEYSKMIYLQDRNEINYEILQDNIHKFIDKISQKDKYPNIDKILKIEMPVRLL